MRTLTAFFSSIRDLALLASSMLFMWFHTYLFFNTKICVYRSPEINLSSSWMLVNAKICYCIYSYVKFIEDLAIQSSNVLEHRFNIFFIKTNFWLTGSVSSGWSTITLLLYITTAASSKKKMFKKRQLLGICFACLKLQKVNPSVSIQEYKVWDRFLCLNINV